MLSRDLTGRTGAHREAEAYSKQYVEVGRGEPARQYVDYEHTGLW
jgi:hypothetical protein